MDLNDFDTIPFYLFCQIPVPSAYQPERLNLIVVSYEILKWCLLGNPNILMACASCGE